MTGWSSPARQAGNSRDLGTRQPAVVVPIVLGRGERLWDGLEGLEDNFQIETVSSPSGVTHVTFSRR